MATDDEPLDDLRAVGMTAGVTAARVIETVARDAQQRAQQQREAAVQAAQRQATTQAALAAVQPQGQRYDSPERRQAADQAMRAAGVPDEARHARNISDLMNGTDPALAASSGRPIKAAAKPQTKAPTRERTR